MARTDRRQRARPVGPSHDQQRRRKLRHGLNYVHDEDGRRTSGLLFIACVGSIASQFTPILQRIDGSDALNEWTTTIGSSIWAMPGGFPADGWLAQGLFDA